MSDLDLIYGTKPKTTPAPVDKKKGEEKLTSKHVSKKVSKQESLQVSKNTGIEEKLLSLLQTGDLKPNTFRYTQQELDFIRDVTYEAEVKYKTKLDKNDVVRIAL